MATRTTTRIAKEKAATTKARSDANGDLDREARAMLEEKLAGEVTEDGSNVPPKELKPRTRKPARCSEGEVARADLGGPLRGATPDPNTGKRKEVWKRGFTTKREAEKWLAEQLARLDAGRYVAPSKMKLADYLRTKWLPGMRAAVRPSTLDSYEMIAEKCVIPRLDGIDLQILDPATSSVLCGVADERRNEGDRPLEEDRPQRRRRSPQGTGRGDRTPLRPGQRR